MGIDQIVGTWRCFQIDYLKVNKPTERYDKLEITFCRDGTGRVTVHAGPLSGRQFFRWQISGDEIRGVGSHRNDRTALIASLEASGTLLAKYGKIYHSDEDSWFSFRYHLNKIS